MSIAGLSPLSYRVIAFTLLLANLLLRYLLAKRLSGSGEIAALTSLLYSFHGRFR